MNEFAMQSVSKLCNRNVVVNVFLIVLSDGYFVVDDGDDNDDYDDDYDDVDNDDHNDYPLLFMFHTLNCNFVTLHWLNLTTFPLKFLISVGSEKIYISKYLKKMLERTMNFLIGFVL